MRLPPVFKVASKSIICKHLLERWNKSYFWTQIPSSYSESSFRNQKQLTRMCRQQFLPQIIMKIRWFRLRRSCSQIRDLKTPLNLVRWVRRRLRSIDLCTRCRKRRESHSTSRKLVARMQRQVVRHSSTLTLFTVTNSSMDSKDMWAF